MATTLAIFGVGLIGGSAALAARRAQPTIHITGYGRSQASLDFALQHGIIDQIGSPDHCPQAELCLVAAPPIASLTILAQLEAQRYPGIVTDAVSVKVPIAQMADRPFWRGRLVPAHPIAGTENRGPQAAHVSLFDGSAAILTPTSTTDTQALDRVRQFWTMLGCRVESMAALDHDRRYAEVSHTPHTIVFALASLLLSDYSPDELAQRSGGGLRGLLRIAASTPEMWGQILALNRDPILALGDRYVEELQHWLALLRNNRGEELESALTRVSEGTRRYLDQWQALRTTDP